MTERAAVIRSREVILLSAVLMAGCVLADKDALDEGVPFSVAYLCGMDGRFDNASSAGFAGVGLVINRSADQAMELADLRVVDSIDDSPRLDFELYIDDTDGWLPPGHAWGQLSGHVQGLLEPVAPEPRFSEFGPVMYFDVTFLEPAPHPFDATVHAHAVVAHNDQVATLPFVITVRSTGEFDGVSGDVCRESSSDANP